MRTGLLRTGTFGKRMLLLIKNRKFRLIMNSRSSLRRLMRRKEFFKGR